MTTVGVTWRHAEQMINGIQLPQLLTTSQPYHQYMVMPFQVVQSLCFNDHFPGGPGLAGTRMSPFWTLMELRMMEVVSGDNWSYGTRKALVKSSPPRNQHPAFLQAECPLILSLNQQHQSTAQNSPFPQIFSTIVC